jgi:flagellar hook-basal body complex protein FliE
MITPLIAAKAYAAAQSTSAGAAGGGAAMGAEAAGGSQFAQLLQHAMGDTINATRQAETQMAAQVQGKAQLVDVVTAISSAQASLETVMAVRDQVISAYQEIMRMPI